MANYIVSDTNLTAVANAIRQKGGTSASLEFPDDFVEAIGDIQTGGGSSVTVEALNVTQNGTYTAPTGTAYSPVTVNVSGSGSDTLAALEANTLTSWTSTATYVNDYMFDRKSALTSVSYPNATTINQYAFRNCSNLTSVNFPDVTTIMTYAFQYCSKLETISLPSVITFGTYCFRNCSHLKTVSINSDFTGYGQTYAFAYCTSLETFDWQKGRTIQSNMFNGSSNMSTLIIRRTGDICTLANTNAFTGTPFASNGSGGTLYVPNDLIASYQSASNWSTILGYTNNQIKKIEGSIYE